MAVDKTEEKKEEAKEEEPSPKKSKLKLIVIIVVAVLLIGGSGAVYFLYFKGGEPAVEGEEEAGTGEEEGEEPTKVEGEEEGEAEAEGEAEVEEVIPVPEFEGGIIVPLDHFIVNINDENEEIRYLKIEIKLELENYELQKEVENKEPKIRDSIVTILTNKSVMDVSDTKGKFKLKEEIGLYNSVKWQITKI
jgi:flagellar FliL protein